MEKASKEEAGNGNKPATRAQYALIEKLLQETEGAAVPPAYTNETLDVAEACKYIDYLKEIKSRAYQDRMNQRKPNGFDRIAFGLCFKLVWHSFDANPPKTPLEAGEVRHMVWKAYELYKECFDYAKGKAEEGGLQ